MRLRFAPLALVLLAASGLEAQTVPVGSCETGEAEAILETGALRAALYDTGGLFWRGSGTVYTVPKETGLTPMFSAALWLSGYVEGDLRGAAAQFGRWEFWPGPLPDPDAPPADCSAYDRIWTVSRQDVARYLVTGEATPDLREWPFDLGAPVLDGDGDPANYDLEAGDQPALLGDVAAWWVMNDAGNVHEGTGFDPLGVEVRVQAFAFDRAFPTDLRTDSFYRYEVVNRRGVPLDSLRVSLFLDPDLGEFADDYFATDTLRQMAFVYNGDDVDDGGNGYGEAPPAFGAQVLRGPVGLPNGRDDDFDGAVDEPGERLRLSTAPPLWKNFGEPSTGLEYVNIQRGLHKGGWPFREFGDGRPEVAPESAPTTVFAFPGDPVAGAFWSEVNTDGAGRANTPRDSRLVATVGPSRLGPGETAAVDLALVFGQGTSRFHSVEVLRGRAEQYLAAFSDGVFEDRRVTADEFVGERPPEGPEPPDVASVSRVRPNPSAGGARAVLTLPEPAHVEAWVLDALGRRLAVVASGALPAGETGLEVPAGLAPGAYVLRVARDRGRPVAVPFTVLPR